MRKEVIMAVAMIMAPMAAVAQTCTEAPSCSSLGYTDDVTSCGSYDFLRCPFDTTKARCLGGGSGPMVGEIRLWPTAAAPAGWLLCDGRSVSASTYKELYNVIGTTYGGSSSNFNLPDFNGRVAVGSGTSYNYTYTYVLGKKGGQNFVALTTDQIPDHKHIVPVGENAKAIGDMNKWGTYGSGHRGIGDNDNDNMWVKTSYQVSRAGYRTAPTSDTNNSWGTAGTCADDRTSTCTTTAHENRMPYQVVNYIIYAGK